MMGTEEAGKGLPGALCREPASADTMTSDFQPLEPERTGYCGPESVGLWCYVTVALGDHCTHVCVTSKGDLGPFFPSWTHMSSCAGDGTVSAHTSRQESRLSCILVAIVNAVFSPCVCGGVSLMLLRDSQRIQLPRAACRPSESTMAMRVALKPPQSHSSLPRPPGLATTLHLAGPLW